MQHAVKTLLDIASRALTGLLNRRPRNNAEITYSGPIGSDELFVIKAFVSDTQQEVGRIVAEPFHKTKCCYISDITVQREFQKLGIARRLITEALQQSKCCHIVPVTVTHKAIAFWSHLAIESGLPVRIGLVQSDLDAIKHAHR